MIRLNRYLPPQFSGVRTLPLHQADYIQATIAIQSMQAMYSSFGFLKSHPGEPKASNPFLDVVAGLEQPHFGGGGDNILVSFAGAAPDGWVLHLRSSHSCIQLPATYAVQAGAFNVFVPFVSSAVAEPTEVTITLTLGRHTINTGLLVLPMIVR